MDVENRIWNLVTEKLANEASEEDLDELNELLRQNPNIHNTMKPLIKWWYDSSRETEYNSYSLFTRYLNE